MDQRELTLKDQETTDNGPVECLGKTFANDEERRTYFLGLLAQKLKDPEFRKTEGFPIGEDEDILNLSDPPYFTACPNPFIEDFIKFHGTSYDASETYKREPYAVDVSEGRSGLFYDAHSYHTKVPFKAIMRYILHYTNPGDIIFDGFCGTGMAGVAAFMCSRKDVVEELGYRVLDDGTIQQNINTESGNKWEDFSRLGARKAVLSDISPEATFISHNFNKQIDASLFEKQLDALFDAAESELGWMYQTNHSNQQKGKINYTIWSDVFICPECSHQFDFWSQAVDLQSGSVRDSFKCPNCETTLEKRGLEKSQNSFVDPVTNKVTKKNTQIPVLINYTYNGKRFEKQPDENDRQVTKRIEEHSIKDWFPTDKLPKGDKTNEPIRLGVSRVDEFYEKRSLVVLATLRRLSKQFSLSRQLDFAISSYDLPHCTKMTRIIFKRGGKKPVLTGYQSGTLYISSLPVEKNIIEGIRRNKKKIISNSFRHISGDNFVETASISESSLPDNSLDYIFLDPPFGANIMYSELNFLPESWLKVFTNTKEEAIENKTQNKSTNDYRNLMSKSFSTAYKKLKPGRWLTVEFSNTKASIWNSIQTALSESGFIVSNVSALDKKQGSFNAVTNPTSVKQDLVISAYKPNGGFEDRFVNESDKEGVWDFIRTHLGYLPVSKKQGNELVKIPERDPRILFDQVIAYFVRNLRDVPISSKEFQDGLLERFAERDGMIFLPEQVAQYDKARITSSQLRQLDIFVDDEASSIEWLRQLLNDKPQTYQEIHPKFLNELSGWKKAEVQLELSTLLEQSFIKYDGKGQVPPQIHSYLSTNFKDLRNLPKDDAVLLQKAKDRWYVPNPEREEDLQKLRERDLLKQFDEYKAHTDRKLKLVRMEAVRYGFKKAWQDRDYATIIDVAEKIPQDLLQEDQKLLMWYDQAQTRSCDSF
jgi:DNA modification methylase